MKRIGWSVVSIFFVAISACQQKSEIDHRYFGETPPDDMPKVFAQGTISKPDRWEGNAVFSEDGREFFFNVFVDDRKMIFHSNFNGESWSEPAPFEPIGSDNNWEPFLTRDGKALYFVSSRPPGAPEWNGRIWKTERNGSAWSHPELIELEYTTDHGYWFPNIPDSNNLYFGGTFPEIGNFGKGDGYVLDAETAVISNIAAINTEHEEWDPYAAPDESFIMWASDRPGGFGATDLYISFKEDGSGDWGQAINMGSKINTADYEVAPRLSPDGKYLFFDRPIDGTQDIFWVSMDEILSLAQNPS